MIVDRLALVERDGVARRSVRVRWRDGEQTVWIDAPQSHAADPGDVSPFVGLCVLPAMRCAEDLEIDGEVSPRTVRGCGEVAELYRAWAPELPRSELRVAAERAPRGGGGGVGCFFSRGVDSTYSAVFPRSRPDPLTELVYVDGLEPLHDEEVRAEEIRRAREVAARIGLPLSVLGTNLRELTHRWHRDWFDIIGVALAALGLSLAGGLTDVVIPSHEGPWAMGPAGSHPDLEPRLSTEAVSIHHDTISHSRVGKARWLAVHRPDAVPGIKVCFAENRADNCGRCAKCLETMAALEAAGVLEAAELFPDAIDPELVAGLDLTNLHSRMEWGEAAQALAAPRHAELRAAILTALGRPFPPEGVLSLPTDSVAIRRRRDLRMIALIRDGRPWPPLDRGERTHEEGRIGLVRAVDRRGGRHLYGVGAEPAGELVGELGALFAEEAVGTDPLWRTPEGHLVTAASHPAAERSMTSVTRWVLAPCRYGAGWAVLARARLAVAGAPATSSVPSGAPVAWLHRFPGPDRLPLWSAVHPITGDQLLSTNRWEAPDLGYGDPILLGQVEARALVTGKLGTGRPRLFWATRLGTRVRPD